MNLSAIIFPFDTFGSAGTGEGAKLLGDVLREAVDEAREEESRITKYAKHLEIHEVEFETLETLQNWRETGREYARTAIAENDFTLWLSGNHLGVLPILEELGPKDLVIQLDAHYDCYDLPSTSESLSHGNFLRELGPNRPKIIHLFSRDLFLQQKPLKQYFDKVHDAADCVTNWKSILDELTIAIRKAKRVWVDVDVDAFDPSFAPAVGHRQPVGMSPAQFIDLVNVSDKSKFAGLSFSEYLPAQDREDTTLTLLAWLTEWLLLKKVQG
ncbi:MAG: arginase family protein [Fimbriiglobus sp.]